MTCFGGIHHRPLESLQSDISVWWGSCGSGSGGGGSSVGVNNMNPMCFKWTRCHKGDGRQSLGIADKLHRNEDPWQLVYNGGVYVPGVPALPCRAQR